MKLQIKEILELNWTEALEDKVKLEAIEWLQENIPDGAILDLEYCGDNRGTYGIAYIMREETDAEEYKRTTRELLWRESNIERMERIQGEELVLQTYLTEHKDNPNIGDLENLFRATMNLERTGETGAASKALRECVARLEKI